MVDGFSSFNNKWLHRDIIAIVKVYCVGQLLDFTADTLLFNFIWLYGYFEGNFDFAVKFSNMTS